MEFLWFNRPLLSYNLPVEQHFRIFEKNVYG